MGTRLIGREDVLTSLPAALDAERWISVVGPPGCGKTTVLRTLVRDREDVTWVNARGLTLLPDLLRSCLDELGEVVAPSDSLEGALGRALEEPQPVVDRGRRRRRRVRHRRGRG